MLMNSESLTPQPAFRLCRRGLLRKLGLAGLGGVLAQAAAAGPARVTSSPRRPTTSILEASADRVLLRTGPLLTFAVPRGARIGVCLLAGAAQPIIRSIAAARSDHRGLSSFLADPRVERGVHRLLGALDTVGPVELYGLSASVSDDIAAGDALEITWEANLRPGGAADLGDQLDKYHACVLGELSPQSTFTSHLSYVEVSRA